MPDAETETPLYVEDVLTSPPAVREVPARTVAPAVIITLECGSIPRLNMVNSGGPAETEALLAWLALDPRCAAVIAAYQATEGNEETDLVTLIDRAAREEAWGDRLYPELLTPERLAKRAATKAAVLAALKSD